MTENTVCRSGPALRGYEPHLEAKLLNCESYQQMQTVSYCIGKKPED